MSIPRLVPLLIAFALTTTVVGAAAQQPNDPPAAPIPIQIITCKKVFISNGGSTSNWGAPNQAYNEFYAAMKSWGKYELVPAPAEADLVFEIRFARNYPSSEQLRLVIRDPKTNTVLWTASENVLDANRAATARKNFDRAMAALIDDVKKILVLSSIATPNPAN